MIVAPRRARCRVDRRPSPQGAGLAVEFFIRLARRAYPIREKAPQTAASKASRESQTSASNGQKTAGSAARADAA